MIATIFLYALESVSVKFLALYLVSKVSEKSGISPPLLFIVKSLDQFAYKFSSIY